MKTPKYACFAVLVLLVSTLVSLAAPRGALSPDRSYLVVAEDLSRWSAGAYTETRDREVKYRGWTRPMTTRTIMGYVGYDVRPWAVPYVTMGTSKTELGDNQGYGD